MSDFFFFMSNFLQSHGLQHARLACPSLFPRVCSNSCSLSRWCYIQPSHPLSCLFPPPSFLLSLTKWNSKQIFQYVSGAVYLRILHSRVRKKYNYKANIHLATRKALKNEKYFQNNKNVSRLCGLTIVCQPLSSGPTVVPCKKRILTKSLEIYPLSLTETNL